MFSARVTIAIIFTCAMSATPASASDPQAAGAQATVLAASTSAPAPDDISALLSDPRDPRLRTKSYAEERQERPGGSDNRIFMLDEPKPAPFIQGKLGGKPGEVLDAASRRFRLVEGDMKLDEAEYNEYLRRRRLQEWVLEGLFTSEKSMLIEKSHPITGRPVRWSTSAFPLKFCVLRDGWGGVERHRIVKEVAQRAAADWESICGVTFQYVDSAESGSADGLGNPPSQVTFAIRPYYRDEFIASAFFPDEPGPRRWVDVNTVGERSFFENSEQDYDRVGVLRHEFGHILGWQHEHTSREAPKACAGESSAGSTPLTEYDPKSVMHYFCGGAGTKKLQFTDLDKQGSREVYGEAGKPSSGKDSASARQFFLAQ